MRRTAVTTPRKVRGPARTATVSRPTTAVNAGRGGGATGSGGGNLATPPTRGFSAGGAAAPSAAAAAAPEGRGVAPAERAGRGLAARGPAAGTPASIAAGEAAAAIAAAASRCCLEKDANAGSPLTTDTGLSTIASVRTSSILTPPPPSTTPSTSPALETDDSGGSIRGRCLPRERLLPRRDGKRGMGGFTAGGGLGTLAMGPLVTASDADVPLPSIPLAGIAITSLAGSFLAADTVRGASSILPDA